MFYPPYSLIFHVLIPKKGGFQLGDTRFFSSLMRVITIIMKEDKNGSALNESRIMIICETLISACVQRTGYVTLGSLISSTVKWEYEQN